MNRVRTTLENNGKTVLLVEPDYHPKYPSIPLLKFSTFLKGKQYQTYYVKGKIIIPRKIDKIMITTLFSFDWEKCIDTILHYCCEFPNSNINVGGIYASLLPKHVYKLTGIQPHIGTIAEVDECAPDYSLLPRTFFNETSHIFTSRGCHRQCEFCGTRLIESEFRIIENWKQHLLPEGKNAVLHDNNILAHGDDHFLSVIDFFKRKKIKFMFDNGFDCRLFEKKHAQELSNAPITQIRFAFDHMGQDGYIQKAIKLCIKENINLRKIMVFILHNWKDDLTDALYRANEVSRLGARPYAMRYKPLNWIRSSKKYVSEKWSIPDLVNFNRFVNRFGIMKNISFSDWIKKYGKYQRNEIKKVSISISEKTIYDGLIEAEARNDAESIFQNHKFIEHFFKEWQF